ncbi:MAG: T9SS type A sorting domain-containing protein [Bacteroidetes bacterium]|nr:T9SS type A sorting domain-containing protein [Bacteroidota bacterium]
MKILLLILLTFTLSIRSACGLNPEWVNIYYSEGIVTVNDFTFDRAGNLILIGYFSGSTDFDPGLTVSTDSGNGQHDVFITKLDGSGNFLWVKTFGGTGFDHSTKVKCDNNDDILLCGTFEYTVDIDPGIGTNFINDSMGNYYLLRLDNNGNYKSVIQSGSSNAIQTFNVKPNNNLILGCRNKIKELDSTNTEIFNLNTGVGDVYDIEIDNEDNIIIEGCRSYAITNDFDPGLDTFIINNVSNMGNDVYILKLDSIYNFKWARLVGGQDIEYVLFDFFNIDDNGNILFSVNSSSEICYRSNIIDSCFTLNTSTPSSYNFKLDINGNLVWMENIFASLNNHVNHGNINTDLIGNIYVSGTYKGTIDFDPGPGVYLRSSPNNNTFIQVLDSNYNFLNYFEYIGGSRIIQLLTDSAGNMYAAGFTMQQVNFDSIGGRSTDTTDLFDSFFIKYNNLSLQILETNFITSSLKIYPNPGKNYINLEYLSEAGKTDYVSLTDLNGRTLYTISIKGYSENKFLQIPDLNLSPGLYNIQLQNEKTRINKKYIKME